MLSWHCRQRRACVIGFLRAVAGLGLGGDAEALLQRQRGNRLVGDRLVVVHHAAAEVGQLDLDGLLGR